MTSYLLFKLQLIKDSALVESFAFKLLKRNLITVIYTMLATLLYRFRWRWLQTKMAESKDESLIQAPSLNEILSNSLLRAILPICVINDARNAMMPTDFVKSLFWRSLLIIGQSQIQRNGLLFQAALTYATLDKQIMYVMTKEFTRFPPTTHSLPKMETGNMANITFKYCKEIKTLEELLIGFCKTQTELLPDVLVVNGLDEYTGGRGTLLEYRYSKMLSLLSETAEYIGRRKNSTVPLYVSIGLSATDQHKSWIELFKQWTHEIWVLEGNSNKLVCGGIQVQFNVLGSKIFLRTVSKLD